MSLSLQAILSVSKFLNTTAEIGPKTGENCAFVK